jgi:hypothetical protein
MAINWVRSGSESIISRASRSVAIVRPIRVRDDWRESADR